MKAQIPDALKADLPTTPWGKVLTATPVVLTVVATLLAGLASSEMTRAQYDRGLAAQLQSKAGDQWAFFQAKRLRGTMNDLTETVLASRDDEPVDGVAVIAAHREEDALWRSPEVAELLRAAAEGRGRRAFRDSPGGIQRAQTAIDQSVAPADIITALHEVSHSVLDEEIEALRADVARQDQVANGDAQVWAKIEATAMAAHGWRAAERWALKRAHLNFEARRYAEEARLNQRIASIYELKVRKVNLSAERHQLRSVRFFYGMLAAQVAVIISTLALAAKGRSWLWSLAAFAGILALGFGLYVHLYL